MIKNTGKKFIRLLTIAAILALYALIAVIVVFFVSRSGTYPDGADTMFYVYRGDLLYRSITENGNWYPLLDSMWYNGVQTLRYWSPVPVYLLAGCQALAGGSCYDGYLLFIGLLYFITAAVWLHIGRTRGRLCLGAFLGAVWFFMPNNLFMLFVEGVLVRSMTVAVLPLFIVFLHDYLMEKKWNALPKMMIVFVIMLMFHLGWAGMIAIATLIFLFFYLLLFRKKDRMPCRNVVIAILLSFLIPGLWVLPSLIGGITGTDSSQIMASFFQPLLHITLNPFYTWMEGHSRWYNGEGAAYFGLAAFVLSVLGVIFGSKKSRPGFCAAVTVCLLTSNVAYTFLRMLPGSQYLWMLRFVSIALLFAGISFFYWKSLRKGLVLLFALLLLIDAIPALQLIPVLQLNITPEARYTALEEKYLFDTAKEITTQRITQLEPMGKVLDGAYVASGFGNNAIPTSTGAGLQAAATFRNIVQLNQSAEDAAYYYMFDRALELGSDTVFVPVNELDKGACDINELDACARIVGYDLAISNELYRIYHMETPSQFGVISKYRAIGIGTSAPMISIAYPAVEETDSTVLDDYTYEQLSQYDVIYLADFTYHDRDYAEDMLLRLSENGVRIIIMADGIPSDEQTGTQTFLGVSAYNITFSSGYPELDTIDGLLNCDLFPDGYSKWRTVYVNGLDDVWGTLYEEGNRLDFFGTAHNENIIFIGLNLTYHYALTRDAAVGKLLTHALSLSPEELPQRTIVPITWTYKNNVITIHSDYDDVNTTLAFHDDIFDSEQDIYGLNHLTHVKRGDTVIRLHYPYLLEGGILTLVGLLMSAVFLHNTHRRDQKRRAALAEAEAPEDGGPDDDGPDDSIPPDGGGLPPEPDGDPLLPDPGEAEEDVLLPEPGIPETDSSESPEPPPGSTDFRASIYPDIPT